MTKATFTFTWRLRQSCMYRLSTQLTGHRHLVLEEDCPGSQICAQRHLCIPRIYQGLGGGGVGWRMLNSAFSAATTCLLQKRPNWVKSLYALLHPILNSFDCVLQQKRGVTASLRTGWSETHSVQFSSVQFSHSVVSDSLWPHETYSWHLITWEPIESLR